MPGKYCMFLNFRDPNSLKTLEVFEASMKYACEGKFSDQDIDEEKLSVFQQVCTNSSVFI